MRHVKIHLKLLLLVLGLLASTASSWAATAAFTGKVTAVKKAETKQKDTLVHFTVKIDYYDYVSRGKFGRQSKVGESIDQRVLKIGSVCLIGE